MEKNMNKKGNENATERRPLRTIQEQNNTDNILAKMSSAKRDPPMFDINALLSSSPLKNTEPQEFDSEDDDLLMNVVESEYDNNAVPVDNIQDKLNTAILESEPLICSQLKRKSTVDLESGEIKRGNIPETVTEQFNDQFFDVSSDASTSKLNENVFEDVNYFRSTFSKQNVDSQLAKMFQTQSVSNQLNHPQRFNDDSYVEPAKETDNESPMQSSQMFLNEIKNNLVRTPNDQTQTNFNDLPCTVYQSNKNASAYIELQRCMSIENEFNLNDDNYIDNELESAYTSSAYQREIEADFNKCEQSIRDMDHSMHNLNQTVQNMDWSENFDVSPVREKLDKTPLIAPTSIIKERLRRVKQLTQRSLFAETNSPSQIVISDPYSSMGPFYGLSLKVKKLIKDFKGIDDLYDWQKECLTLPAINRRNNLIYALPTSGGKTLVAEILILREILCRRRNCIFILPYVSIVQEKIWALSSFAVNLEFLVEEYAAGKGALPPRKRLKKKSVYIATIEKALALIDSLIEADRANEIGLVVVDELHLIGEVGRGATLEALLTKLLFINVGVQIIGMSATIGNLNELAKFLNADVYTRNFRPIELKEYVKCGSDILEINSAPQSIDTAFEFVRSVNFDYHKRGKHMDPDHLCGLVAEVIPDNSCLIFCPSKQNCENVAVLLYQLLPAKYAAHKSAEKAALCDAIKSDTGTLCKILARTIQYGIAYHHSGLTMDERRHLEDAFRQNILCVICCTSTLAAGVNLPAKRVIMRAPYIGREFITLSKYKQMVGRAGRAGIETQGESILICQPRDNLKVANLLCSPMDEAASCMHLDECKGVQNLIMSSIGLQLIARKNDIHNLMSKTLLATQAIRLNVNMAKIIEEALEILIRLKAFKSASSKEIEMESFSSQPTTSKKMEIIGLSPLCPIEISQLGKAAFKSCIDVQKAHIIYNDLVKAQEGLVLIDHLHLMYIITPYEPEDVNVRPDNSVYYQQLSKLSAAENRTVDILGINEVCIMKLLSGQNIQKPELARIVNRFFFTLVLKNVWNYKPIHEVAETFGVSRGVVHQLITAAAAYSSKVLKFCEELNEFWAFAELLKVITKRISYCCAAELVPLMELPCVKLGRAKQLYSVGYRSIESIAKTTPAQLANVVEHLNYRVAAQMISAAKLLLLERVETLREQVQDCLDVLVQR